MRDTGVVRRPLLPLRLDREKLWIPMAHAGPSSSQKPMKQKQKQNVKKAKKSTVGRQTVELLDKTALEYVRARLPLCTPPHCNDRGYFRSPRMTSRLSQICQYRN